jgi:hypothetical protein
MKRHSITLIVLAASALFYIAGWNDGSAALLAVGCIFELIFWSRILRSPGSASAGKPDA